MVLSKPKDRIILALDTSDEERATYLIQLLCGHVGYFKIGLELIHAGLGPKIVEMITKEGGKVFYDAKLNDIPETTKRATKNITKMNVAMLTIHANSGYQSMQMAVKEKAHSKIIAVTVLTSMSCNDCSEIYNTSAENVVVSFARNASFSGCDGIVCSPHELEILKKYELPNLLRITPGIRPTWHENNDQKRTATPKQAILSGADYLVIGRAITSPQSMTSLEAVERIKTEISKAQEERIKNAR
jgi:orotidine-5'-phosphate decarboxylase